MKNIFSLLLISIVIIGCQGNRIYKEENQNKEIQNDTTDECIVVTKFLENESFLKVYHNEAFPGFFLDNDTFINNDAFYLHSAWKEISETEFSQNEMKRNDVLSFSDTLRLNLTCVLLGSYNGINYQIKSFEKQINSYFIFYESEESYDDYEYGYLLINKKTSKVIEMSQEPIISPNGRMMLTTKNDGEPKVLTTMVFYKINDNDVIIKKGLWEKDLQIGRVYWASDKKIFIQAFTVDNEEKYFSMEVN